MGTREPSFSTVTLIFLSSLMSKVQEVIDRVKTDIVQTYEKTPFGEILKAQVEKGSFQKMMIHVLRKNQEFRPAPLSKEWFREFLKYDLRTVPKGKENTAVKNIVVVKTHAAKEVMRQAPFFSDINTTLFLVLENVVLQNKENPSVTESLYDEYWRVANIELLTGLVEHFDKTGQNDHIQYFFAGDDVVDDFSSLVPENLYRFLLPDPMGEKWNGEKLSEIIESVFD